MFEKFDKLKLNFSDYKKSDNSSIFGIQNLTTAILNSGNNITYLSLDLGKYSEFSETGESQFSQLFSVTRLRNLKLKNSEISGTCLLCLKDEFIESIEFKDFDCIETSYKCITKF